MTSNSQLNSQSSRQPRQRRPFWLGVSLLSWSLLLGSGQPLPVLAETDWYLLKANGHTIGEVQVNTSHNATGRKAETVTDVVNTNRFLRQGEPFEMSAISRFVEDSASGRAIGFTHHYDLGPQRVLDAQGQVQGNRLNLKLLQAEHLSVGQTPVAGEAFRFPAGNGLAKVYRAHYHDPQGSRFHFQTLNLGATPSLVETEVTPLHTETLAMADGDAQVHSVRKFELKNPSNPDSTVYEWRDAQGKLHKAQTVGRNALEMVRVSQRMVRQTGPLSLDVMTASEIMTNLIPQPRLTTEALYRLSPLNGNVLDWSKLLPTTAMQQSFKTAPDAKNADAALSPDRNSTAAALAPLATHSDAPTNKPSDASDVSGAIYLKVKSKEPVDVEATYPIAAIDTTARYLGSTPYLQAEDPIMVQTAAEVVGQEKRAYYAARKLQQWVYKHVSHKNLSLGFASAKETLLQREGDCTEHAVLLAALARSLGIPARVAVGLIYLPSDSDTLGRFVYHMWTEVYVGQANQGEWTALDASNPEGLPDATHIKLGHSALSNSQDLTRLTEAVAGVMGRFRIDVLTALSSAQSIVSVGNQPSVLKTQISKTETKAEPMTLERVDIRRLSTSTIQRFHVGRMDDALSLDSADGLFTQGVSRLHQGDYDGAKKAFESVLSKTRRPLALYRLGEQLASVEMYGLARQAFDKAAQGNRALAPLVEGWYRSYLPAQTLSTDLEREFLRGVYGTSQRPSSLEAASNASQNGSPSTTSLADPNSIATTGKEEQLRAVIAKAPGFAPAYRHLAEHMEASAAIRALQKAVALSPNDFQNAEALGDRLMAENRDAEAAQAYTQAISAITGQAFAHGKPWWNTLEGKRRMAVGGSLLAKSDRNAVGWLEIGKGLMLQSRTAEAGKAFQNALALNSGLTEALLGRFQVALQESDWERAAILKARVLSVSGKNALALRLLGQYQSRTRHYAKAVQSLKQAIVLSPSNPEGYLLLSQAYQRFAEQQEATPSSKSASLATRYHQQSVSILQQGLTRVTAADARPLLALALAKQLLAHQEGRQPTQAKALADDVLNKNPLNVQAYALKGQAQFYLDDLEGARDTLQTAHALSPHDAQVLTQLGHVAKAEGRDSLALDFYQKAHQADPFRADAAIALRKLMTDLHLSGKIPAEYWALSDDEHDYLVQALYAARQMKQGNLEYMRQLSQLLGESGQIPYSVDGIQSVQAFVPFLRTMYDAEFKIYNELKAMLVPRRLSGLHSQLTRLAHQDLQLYQRAMGRFATWQATRAASEAYEATLQDIAATLKTLSAEMAMLASRLPVPVYKGLLAEAGIIDTAGMSQDLDKAAQSLNNAMTRKAQEDAKRQAEALEKQALQQQGQAQGLPNPTGAPRDTKPTATPVQGTPTGGNAPASMTNPATALNAALNKH